MVGRWELEEVADLSVVLKPFFHMCQNFNRQFLLTAMSVLHFGQVLPNKLFYIQYLRTD